MRGTLPTQRRARSLSLLRNCNEKADRHRVWFLSAFSNNSRKMSSSTLTPNALLMEKFLTPLTISASGEPERSCHALLLQYVFSY